MLAASYRTLWPLCGRLTTGRMKGSSFPSLQMKRRKGLWWRSEGHSDGNSDNLFPNLFWPNQPQFSYLEKKKTWRTLVHLENFTVREQIQCHVLGTELGQSHANLQSTTCPVRGRWDVLTGDNNESSRCLEREIPGWCNDLWWCPRETQTPLCGVDRACALLGGWPFSDNWLGHCSCRMPRALCGHSVAL